MSTIQCGLAHVKYQTRSGGKTRYDEHGEQRSLNGAMNIYFKKWDFGPRSLVDHDLDDFNRSLIFTAFYGPLGIVKTYEEVGVVL